MPAPVVSVRVVLRGRDTGADREALLAFTAQVTGAPPGAVTSGRRCPHCRGTDHGRPWAVVDGQPVGVSLARTTGILAMAVTRGEIGVDVERRSRVAAAPLDVLGPGERARYGADARSLAGCWAAKESVLKRDGRGLRVDPAEVDVDLGAGTAVLRSVVHPVTVRWLDDDLVLAVSADGLVEIEDLREEARP